VAFIRLLAALIGFVFGFFLGANLLQVTQVTPANNQVLVVLLLATACAILGWLGAPYVTVMPAAIVVERIRAASAGDLIGGAFGAAIGDEPTILGLRSSPNGRAEISVSNRVAPLESMLVRVWRVSTSLL